MLGLAQPTAPAAAARDVTGRQGVKSREAARIVSDLLAAPVPARRSFLTSIKPGEMAFILQEAQRVTGSLYGLWHDTPSGFVEDVLGETLWGLQKQVIDAIAIPGIKRVVVPAAFGVGKTYLAGRMVAWAGAVNPVGSMVIVTTATRMRQVSNQLWPHIKTAVAKGNIHGGETDQVQWKAKDQYGNDVRIAYGFTAPEHDEAAMQGVHGTPRLLLVVDEAGGIAPLIGAGTNNLLTGDAKLLAIGNPAMDTQGSWFEKVTLEGESGEEPTTRAIRISALDSPGITGEPTPVCRACVPNIDGHTIAGGVPSHLPDRDWLNRTLRDYGVIVPADAPLHEVAEAARDSHPYIVAKVMAEFPKGTGNQVMPASWVEAAELAEDPTGEGYVRPCDLGLADETDTFTVKRGAWIRLGVDVAADGGDEFAVYRAIGDVVHQVHSSSGAQNADPVVVGEKVLDQIDRAQKLADALGTEAKVRVKVDGNGLGWGVVGNLQRWGKNDRHKAEIVNVMVSESCELEDEGAVMRPYRKRDELWLAGRFLMQPDPSTGFGRLRLRVDQTCKVQMSLPKLGNNAQGYTVVESKKSMRARGVSSPDRAEAALLALYEPIPLKRRRRGLLN
ncbi:hypothetical protein ABN028_19350 [Actinopolymorpha sp. B17G11]|uniref:hypothetical protein n=1 Tax=Actinopolymorpha sp. B17G11 TaxID=3160861 RepID=UPI0032E51900